MFLEIVIDAPLRRTFDYRCPPAAPTNLIPGMRVRVPFGRRRLVGVLIKTSSSSDIPSHKLKTAIEVLDREPALHPELLGLLIWAANYYHHPLGEVLAAALPVPLRQGAPLAEEIESWRLTDLGIREWTALPKRFTRLRMVAAALAREADAELAGIPGWRAALKQLEERGWVNRVVGNAERASAAIGNVSAKHVLSEAQDTAVQRIVNARGGFRSFLLHGVTGSGKTEVYLQAIEAVVASGRQALVLVPEIALTPQLVARFQERFSTPLAVLHSSLNDRERLRAWRAARSGAAPILIGTRSAVFAPLPSLGLIVVDEEHDSSYKQQEGFRYSARDLAIARAQRLNIPVVLGSATPSLESLARVKKQPENLISLPARAGDARPPQMRLIDLRAHAQTDGIATPTLQAIERHLANSGQVLLYLNRRGYAPVLFCPSCGWSALCTRCDARMTVHRRSDKLVCHHCGYEQPMIASCENCRAEVKPVGEGTERIEATVARIFPNHRCERIDRDNIRRRGDLEATLARIHSKETDILIGTQMLTKGHHFPDVTLVVVLNADQGLFGVDFRAAERLAQSIVQVAGRAGRAERAGEVLIQTEFPEHPLIQDLMHGGYAGFAERALTERERAHWPPFARLALVRAEATAMQHALALLTAARNVALQSNDRNVRVLGPVAAPMPRRAGRHRAQLLLHAPTHAPLQKLLARLIPAIETLPQAKRARWSLDVDPIELF